MKVLIVDDSPRRYKALTDRLIEEGISEEDVHCVTCAQHARASLAEHNFDLMILDVVLPLRAQDDPQPQHSRELLEQLIEDDDLIRPRQIVGITAHADVTKDTIQYFQDNLWTVVDYTDASDAWLEQIINCLRFLKGGGVSDTSQGSAVDVAVVCALSDPELSQVLRLPWNWSAARPLDEATFIHAGHFEVADRKITVAAASASRMGMVSSALLSAKLIQYLSPKFVVMTGICAGMKSKTNFGDVVLADPCWDWQSGKRTHDEGQPVFAISPHQIGVDPSVRAKFEQLKMRHDVLAAIQSGFAASSPSTKLKLVIGPMASGSSVLADPNATEEIRKQHRELCAVEMEAYGVYAAATYAGSQRPRVFAIKSVCDFADSDKNDEFQQYAAYTSAKAMEAFFQLFAEMLFGCPRQSAKASEA